MATHATGLATRLKRLRARRGLTQVELANKAGLSSGYVARLEAGRYHDPSLSTLAKLAKALNVPIGGLLK